VRLTTPESLLNQLLEDEQRIAEARAKAQTNKHKYGGVSNEDARRGTLPSGGAQETAAARSEPVQAAAPKFRVQLRECVSRS